MAIKILFLAPQGSIHSARWINQLRNNNYDLHLFDCHHGLKIHRAFRDITVHSIFPFREPHPSVYNAPLVSFSRGFYRFRKTLPNLYSAMVTKALSRIIKKLKPDCIQSMPMQTQAYKLLDVHRLSNSQLDAPWIYSCWGNDIYHYRTDQEHLSRIHGVLGACDYLITDCNRDVELARRYGFKGKVLGVFPGPGGYDVQGLKQLAEGKQSSSRSLILIKGHHGYVGRAVNILNALVDVSELLGTYELAVYSCHKPTREAIPTIEAELGRQIRIIPTMAHTELMREFGRARLHIALSISDGTPNAMLEAMIMGAFPIQSDTGSEGEWIEDGRNGLLVDPEDISCVGDAIRRALQDDHLIDNAASINQELMLQRVDESIIRPRVLDMYQTVMAVQ